MSQAKELHDLLNRVGPRDLPLVRALLERIAVPYDDEPVTQEDIGAMEYCLKHPEDRLPHEEILKEFGLAAGTAAVVS